MKKNTTKDQKPHRLRLNRETIQVLNDPALLAVAGEGRTDSDQLSAGGFGCQIATDSKGC